MNNRFQIDDSKMIDALKKCMEQNLNDDIDEIIELKLQQFKDEMIKNKSIVISELLESIRIITSEDQYSMAKNYSIILRGQ